MASVEWERQILRKSYSALARPPGLPETPFGKGLPITADVSLGSAIDIKTATHSHITLRTLHGVGLCAASASGVACIYAAHACEEVYTSGPSLSTRARMALA